MLENYYAFATKSEINSNFLLSINYCIFSLLVPELKSTELYSSTIENLTLSILIEIKMKTFLIV